MMNLINKIDATILWPFQKIVSFLESKGRDASLWLVIWSTVSAVFYIIAEALQTYMNMALGHDNYGYTEYAGIKSLELKALYLNVQPFIMTILLAVVINSKKPEEEGGIGNFFLSMVTRGEPTGLLARILYVYVFALTVYDISEMESIKTLWHVINRYSWEYHYYLGLDGAIAIILCFFSFLMAAISMFFIGCDYTKEK